MARYMTDIERKELINFTEELSKSLKELREKIPNYKSEEELEKMDYDKLAEEQAQQDAYESGRVFFYQ
jgi:site-specific DNA-adenine methylase